MVLAASGELPFGTLSAPGAGMLPKLCAGLMMVCAALVAAGGGRSERVAALGWSEAGHAAKVLAITAVAVLAYRPLGFLLTMSLLVFALLVLVERRNALAAAAYGIGLTLFAYWLFGKALKSPLERGIVWF